MAKENVLKTKSFDFAVRIVNLYKFLKKEYNEFVLSQQIVGSGTAIGALIREAEHAESLKDFVHKLNIALKKLMNLNTGSTFYTLQNLLIKKCMNP
jgi:four helix bundle protein